LTSVSSVSRRWSKTKIIAVTVVIAAVLFFAVLFVEGPLIEPLGVGIIEEIAKLIGPIFIALKAPYYLKSKKGTLALAVASALVFALIEDFGYIFLLGANVATRLLILPTHLLWTGIAAFGVSMAVMQSHIDPSLKKNFFRAYLTEGPIVLFLVAVFLHAAWDGIAFYTPDYGSFLVGIGFIYALSVVMLVQAYRHFPEKMTTYKYPGAKNLLRSMVGIPTA
jgi:RsiW-degrading membrane proteinase PrsW (M82 family)